MDIEKVQKYAEGVELILVEECINSRLTAHEFHNLNMLLFELQVVGLYEPNRK